MFLCCRGDDDGVDVALEQGEGLGKDLADCWTVGWSRSGHEKREEGGRLRSEDGAIAALLVLGPAELDHVFRGGGRDIDLAQDRIAFVRQSACMRENRIGIGIGIGIGISNGSGQGWNQSYGE
ncbi:LOW QUALITY PROTEIN: hypothetical protein CVT25_008241 [Psilocybe cyanescens]|uniref:Uncharacterized protein n=1 Tax=Psilocybe cyanescens TaxID=93625 RepID=A0A409X6W5_PSICY|nr:LOW QUALITY PROTEIN: hypothetical protein CVT25_008241 [Psilocybe cyanescens]